MKKYFLLFLLCNASLLVNAQQTSQIIKGSNDIMSEMGNSPTAANFRVHGEFPASNFIGVTDIDVPVYTISYRDFKFPISLKYHNGMGNKVNVMSGPTGLGWHLTSGGAVTLVESRKSEASTGGMVSVEYDVVAPDNWSEIENLTRLIGCRISSTNPISFVQPLYCNPSQAKSIVNYSTNSLQKNVFAYNFNGHSGEVYFDHEEKPQIRSKDGGYLDVKFELIPRQGNRDDLEANPQKLGGFWFKLPDMKSYYDRDVIVKSYDNVEGQKIYDNQGSVLIDNGNVYKITFTDGQGIKYIFGGKNDAIELSRPGHSADQPSYDKNLYKIRPITWNLTKILFPNQETIEFEYKRGEALYSSISYVDLKTNFALEKKSGKVVDKFTQSKLMVDDVDGTLINPVYLTKITGVKEVLDFSYSKSVQMQTDLKRFVGFNNSRLVETPYRHWVSDFAPDYVAKKRTFFFYYTNDVYYTNFMKFNQLPERLDRILISDKTEYSIKKVDFSYTQIHNLRQKLLGMEITGTFLGQATQPEKYRFRYGTVGQQGLPPYESYSTDHFGFFNSKNNYPGYVYNSADVQYKKDWFLFYKNSAAERKRYEDFRAPEVSVYNSLEVLSEIQYPTGGYTQFQYEPNMYGGIAKNYPFVVQPNEGNQEKPAGGIRIKQIKNFDVDHTLLSSKSYAYVKNYAQAGSSSSGVLAHMPTYFDFIKADFDDSSIKDPLGTNILNAIASDLRNVDYFNFSSRDIYPADRLRGNHITYSEVAEIDDVDKSFTIYQFKNFDNGYHDKPALQHVSHLEEYLKDEYGNKKNLWKNWDIISMGLERGQLKSKTLYKTVVNTFGKRGVKIKETNYEYNDNPNRFDSHIRVINRYLHPIYSPGDRDLESWSYISSMIYTYHPYLKKETTTDYPNASAVGLENSESTYQYHEKYRNISEKIVKKGNKTYKTIYKYPYDFAGFYSGMVSENIIEPIIEQQEYINNKSSSAVKVNYYRVVPVLQTMEPFLGNISKIDHAEFNSQFLYLPQSIEVQRRNSPWEKKIEFLLYDRKGNVLSQKNEMGLTTNYIFGYNKIMPVWKIDNVSYTTISNLLGTAEIERFSNDLIPDSGMISQFESKFSQNITLKKAPITRVYSNIHMGPVQIKSINDVIEHYKYDENGRLKQVEDSDKNILIKYDYNYKQN